MKPSAVPPAATAVFGPASAAAARYAAWLAGPGVERGLIGPREVERLWDRHLINCAALRVPLEQALPIPETGTAAAPAGRVCDLGSGAGLPGVVVALLRPDLELVLLEPMLRRTTFLSEVVADLGLPRTTVVRGRAEELASQSACAFDVVIARAVAPLGRLAAWALPLLRPGGQLLALKGDQAVVELADAAPSLDRHRAGAREVLEIPASPGEPPTRVVRVVAGR